MNVDGSLIADLPTEGHVVSAARLILGHDGVSVEEKGLSAHPYSPKEAKRLLSALQASIAAGQDPLGDAFCAVRSQAARRDLGQTYTPAPIVDAMYNWAAQHGTPSRIVDPGAGSGRYVMYAGRIFPNAQIVAADIDPIATLMLRANAKATGSEDRVTVVYGDYRALKLDPIEGPTLFIGNPPYVRHHQISGEWKRWLLETAKKEGVHASALAGLHVHFFLATAKLGRPGDFGSFITSAEWLDVNYGKLVRELLLGPLGGESLHVLEPTAEAFTGTQTTAAISCFKIGAKPETMKVRRVESVEELRTLDVGRTISRQRLSESSRWSTLTRVAPKLPEGYVELGELCRVHRGAVTGANKVWVAKGPVELPEDVLYPSVTKAVDLFTAGERLTDAQSLKRVIDLPVDLDVFDASDRKLIDKFLRSAKRLDADAGYVARNRRAWWSVGLREAAPVLATYMARRPPAFVRNDVEARHINIAHGLYPREAMAPSTLDALADHLRGAVSLAQGRTYAGGLTKFEPKEMERLPVPSLEVLSSGE